MSGFDLFDDDDFLDAYEKWYTTYFEINECDPPDKAIEGFQEHYLKERNSWHKLSHDLENVDRLKEIEEMKDEE